MILAILGVVAGASLAGVLIYRSVKRAEFDNLVKYYRSYIGRMMFFQSDDMNLDMVGRLTAVFSCRSCRDIFLEFENKLFFSYKKLSYFSDMPAPPIHPNCRCITNIGGGKDTE